MMYRVIAIVCAGLALAACDSNPDWMKAPDWKMPDWSKGSFRMEPVPESVRVEVRAGWRGSESLQRTILPDALHALFAEHDRVHRDLQSRRLSARLGKTRPHRHGRRLLSVAPQSAVGGADATAAAAEGQEEARPKEKDRRPAGRQTRGGQAHDGQAHDSRGASADVAATAAGALALADRAAAGALARFALRFARCNAPFLRAHRRMDGVAIIRHYAYMAIAELNIRRPRMDHGEE